MPADVGELFPRAAAANAGGAAIFMRLGPSARDGHPGIVLLDDLNAEAVTRLTLDGFQPALTVETSPGNCQVWIKLIAAGELPYPVVRGAVKHLSELFGADPRATSPMQPGRLPGFTNRKPKHRQADGHFPFVRLVDASGCIAAAGTNLVDEIKANLSAQRGRAPRAARETPPVAAVSGHPSAIEDFDALDRIRQAQEARIWAEARRGSRPREAASASEIDFAAVVVALGEGVSRPMLEAWLRMRRPEKAAGYAALTVQNADRYLEDQTSTPQPSGRP
ncbi:DNA-primase RepB domain-containing protein [Stappia indica]|uniref:DNA-primase RepB domain-containing protein n=1 Tax=Stappia indica TaxID=538381 RepID=UPI001CD3DCF2|nr:DNA-primase RepB domain-containing protein [Stappia indica]MCA1300848.1 RepB family DNA primase [Stappia indica]